MILKIGIQNENDSTVIVRTFDNISMAQEEEPQVEDRVHKERLIHFLRPSYSGSPEEDLTFNIDWDDNIIFAYLMNDMGKTFKVLKHDKRLWNRHTDSTTDPTEDKE